jgi:peptidyl-prolyl cis-trans isomerase SurA
MTMTPRKPFDRYRFLVLAALVGAILGTGSLRAEPAAAELVDRIVAVVNDDVILLSELEQATAPYLERLSTMGYPPEKEAQMRYKVREDILAQLIDRQLTDQEVRRLGISVTPAEIDSAIERVKETNFLTDETLREAIAQQGYTMAQYRENVRNQILRTKLVNQEIRSRTVITDEDIKAYYESHPEEFAGQRRYHLRSILLPRDLPDLARRQRQIDEALEGGASFAEVARQYSRAPQAPEGGDLGEFPLASLSPTVRRAVEPLAEGETSAWVDTEQGYQRFHVDKIRGGEGRSLEEVAARIQETLYKQFVDEKFRSWLEALRQRSYIHVVK